MKIYIQNSRGNTAQNLVENPSNWGIFYMSGNPPQTESELRAAVNLKSPADIHAKSVGGGFLRGTTALSTTGVGQFSTLYTMMSANMSWLKKNTIPTSFGYTQMPDRVYSETGYDNLYYMPFAEVSFPSTMLNIWNAPNFVSVGPAIKRMRNTTAHIMSQESFRTIVEYDTAVTVNLIYMGGWRGRFFNNYMGNNSARYGQIGLDYWDEATSSWKVALAPTLWQYVYSQDNASAFTAVTSTKFRIRKWSAPYDTWTSSNTYNEFCSGTVLGVVGPTAIPVPMPDITWGILVPLPNTNETALDAFAGGYIDGGWIENGANITVSYMTNPYIRQVPYSLHSSLYVPALIDTCSDDPSTSYMVLNKSRNLMSNDRPSLVSYKYILGDFV